MKTSIRSLVTLALVAAACMNAPAHVLHAAVTPGQYYLALGDSLAYGVTAPGIPPDPTCSSPQAPGYVCIVYGYLKGLNPGLQLENLSAQDVDSCVMVLGFGNGSPCVNKPGPGTLASPLQSAVSFIKGHPGQVDPVTVNVGGADLIPLLPAALTDPTGTAEKLPLIVRFFQENLDTVLSALRSAVGPGANIILVTQYNPLGGIGSPPLPAGLPAIASGAINGLNSIMKTVAAKYNVRVADAAAAFDGNPGGGAVLTFVPTSLASGDPSKIDIYPDVDGYRLLGQTVLRTAGYVAPLTVKARLGHARVRRHGHEGVRGTVTSGAIVHLQVALPKGVRHRSSVQANNTGAFSTSVAVGKHPGRAKVQVCITDPVANASKCAKVAAFTVT